MNVLVIAPHPDDEAIGCGGTLALHAERGDSIAAVFLTSGELGLKHLPRAEAWRVREAEAERAAAVLGIAATTFLRLPDWYLGEDIAAAGAALARVLDRQAPGVIYLPHPHEWHPDHQAALPILRSALVSHAGASAGAPPALWAYEIWTPLQLFDRAEDITTTMGRKLRAVRTYASQLAGFRYDRAVRGLNQYRGVLAARCRFAEVFAAVSIT
jgi:LmbE family N-acetylglucosaminyl deacetylase